MSEKNSDESEKSQLVVKDQLLGAELGCVPALLGVDGIVALSESVSVATDETCSWSTWSSDESPIISGTGSSDIISAWSTGLEGGSGDDGGSRNEDQS